MDFAKQSHYLGTDVRPKKDFNFVFPLLAVVYSPVVSSRGERGVTAIILANDFHNPE